MTLIKKSSVPSLWNDKWMTDFFDTNRFFDSDVLKFGVTTAIPAVNVKELEKEFVVELAAPGMSKKDFNISVENGILLISAEVKQEKEEKEETFTRREFNFSSFTRSFTLPENVNEDKINANYEDGILKLTLAKKVATKTVAKKEINIS